MLDDGAGRIFTVPVHPKGVLRVGVERPTRLCDGQVSTYFWPYSGGEFSLDLIFKRKI